MYRSTIYAKVGITWNNRKRWHHRNVNCVASFRLLRYQFGVWFDNNTPSTSSQYAICGSMEKSCNNKHTHSKYCFKNTFNHIRCLICFLRVFLGEGGGGYNICFILAEALPYHLTERTKTQTLFNTCVVLCSFMSAYVIHT